MNSRWEGGNNSIIIKPNHSEIWFRGLLDILIRVVFRANIPWCCEGLLKYFVFHVIYSQCLIFGNGYELVLFIGVPGYMANFIDVVLECMKDVQLFRVTKDDIPIHVTVEDNKIISK